MRWQVEIRGSMSGLRTNSETVCCFTPASAAKTAWLWRDALRYGPIRICGRQTNMHACCVSTSLPIGVKIRVALERVYNYS